MCYNCDISAVRGINFSTSFEKDDWEMDGWMFVEKIIQRSKSSVSSYVEE